MTADDIRQLLKLESFDAFAERQKAANKAKGLGGDDLVRNTGRTTRLECEALARLHAGRDVVVDASTWQRAAITAIGIRRRAEVLGIDCARLSTVEHVVPAAGTVLVDHSEVERQSGIQWKNEQEWKAAAARAPKRNTMGVYVR